jgi:hypothetical protein
VCCGVGGRWLGGRANLSIYLARPQDVKADLKSHRLLRCLALLSFLCTSVRAQIKIADIFSG